MEIKFIKIKNFFKKLPRILGEQAFLTFLSFYVIAAIFGTFLFYKYSVLAERATPKITITPVHFNEASYQKILKEWLARQKKFEEVNQKEYFNPFWQPTAVPGPEELTE